MSKATSVFLQRRRTGEEHKHTIKKDTKNNEKKGKKEKLVVPYGEAINTRKKRESDEISV